jgi:hypothetical protein
MVWSKTEKSNQFVLFHIAICFCSHASLMHTHFPRGYNFLFINSQHRWLCNSIFCPDEHTQFNHEELICFYVQLWLSVASASYYYFYKAYFCYNLTSSLWGTLYCSTELNLVSTLCLIVYHFTYFQQALCFDGQIWTICWSAPLLYKFSLCTYTTHCQGWSAYCLCPNICSLIFFYISSLCIVAGSCEISR